MQISYTTKQLPSGNLQVKFSVEGGEFPRYGYLLIEGDRTDEEIYAELWSRITMRKRATLDLMKFSFKEYWKDDNRFFIYTA
ncbi:hypothetical protein ADIS_3222 [Lunatimonas lonarensis]|uniref:Uncharacterized protein n=1 Tax=Lunatimonas lonarensis TaxID=1232681 RepID=R7ZQ19_9BACT|nr:hypothetical protein [Lunatimonas lonarensis]EON76094.1 hypothetical protein ADIS_3222 [Lunatimonas lonarensis]